MLGCKIVAPIWAHSTKMQLDNSYRLFSFLGTNDINNKLTTLIHNCEEFCKKHLKPNTNSSKLRCSSFYYSGISVGKYGMSALIIS